MFTLTVTGEGFAFEALYKTPQSCEHAVNALRQKITEAMAHPPAPEGIWIALTDDFGKRVEFAITKILCVQAHSVAEALEAQVQAVQQRDRAVAAMQRSAKSGLVIPQNIPATMQAMPGYMNGNRS